jgi:hypothetical protein
MTLVHVAEKSTVSRILLEGPVEHVERATRKLNPTSPGAATGSSNCVESVWCRVAQARCPNAWCAGPQTALSCRPVGARAGSIRSV